MTLTNGSILLTISKDDKMKAKELMIGDWVNWHTYTNRPDYCKIKQISFDTRIEGSDDFNCEPIPLTEDTLKANGFEDKSEKARYGTVLYGLSVGNVSVTFEVDNGLPILTIEDTADSSSQHNIICLKDEIYNVHELQHALRLCGLTELADNFKIGGEEWKQKN